VVESLRQGLPADGFVRQFTVGRTKEIQRLSSHLQQGRPGALLVRANYGSGKTHLLRFVRELALEQGYAVSRVTLDAKGGVRFNRLDQILGAVWRGLEVPGLPAACGPAALFASVSKILNENRDQRDRNSLWYSITNKSRWHFNDGLISKAMLVALRSWYYGNEGVRALVEDWLYNPGEYQSQNKGLYEKLVVMLEYQFRETRSKSEMYRDGVFRFRSPGYAEVWDMLHDMHMIAQAAGLRGLAILFDEFEDVITNLNNVVYEREAFSHLFEFFGGQRVPSLSFFAVTPEFAEKCISRLEARFVHEYDLDDFERLPKFEMSPLSHDDLVELARIVVNTHGVAYGWTPGGLEKHPKVMAVVKQLGRTSLADRTRQVIKSVVETLDDHIAT
jgi:hypothetical protein